VIGSIMTMAGYRKAPRATYMLKHPVKSVKIMRTRRMIRNRLTDPRIAAGLGAALALPIGLWMRHRMRASA